MTELVRLDLTQDEFGLLVKFVANAGMFIGAVGLGSDSFLETAVRGLVATDKEIQASVALQLAQVGLMRKLVILAGKSDESTVVALCYIAELEKRIEKRAQA